MSEEQTSRIQTALLSILPILAILMVDTFALILQPNSKAISHFAFAVLIGQLLCQIVFIKGQICPGQRGRLSQVNFYALLFWLFWLLLSLFSTYHYLFTDLICLCGIALTLSTWKQPREDSARHTILVMGGVAGILGLVLYIISLQAIPALSWAIFSPFHQLTIGILFAYLSLLLSRNRLQSFIALLPLGGIISLALSAIFVLILLIMQHETLIINNPYAYILYFSLYFVLIAAFAYPIVRKQKFEYLPLLMILFIALSLPIWLFFV